MFLAFQLLTWKSTNGLSLNSQRRDMVRTLAHVRKTPTLLTTLQRDIFWPLCTSTTCFV